MPNSTRIRKARRKLTKWIDEAFDAREDEAKRDCIKNGQRKLRINLSPSRPSGQVER